MKTIQQLLAFVFVTALAVASASAQQHTVVIGGGEVVVDGRTLPADELPPSLDLEGLTADVRFSGDAFFQLNNVRYRVADGTLVEAPSGSREFVVMLHSDDGNTFTMSASAPAHVWTNDSPVVGTYIRALDSQAEKLGRLGTELTANKNVELAGRVLEESEEAVAMMRAFPRIEFQGYLHDMEGRDKPLYDRIMKEQLMEIETRRLAGRILSTPDPARRDALSKDLNGLLDEIFELKQQNRRDEIEQLEDRLNEMRQQLEDREHARAELIERRLRELTGLRDRLP